MPAPDSQSPSEDQDIAVAIAELEKALENLKYRYQQVHRDQARQQELLERQKELKKQKVSTSDTLIKQELKQIQEELHNLELNLESRLWKFKELKEPFWQAVRFGGLGVLLGWLLKSCAG